MMLLSSILTRIFLDGRTVGLEDEGISQYNFAQSPQGAFCLPPARMVQFTKFMASRVSFYVCSIHTFKWRLSLSNVIFCLLYQDPFRFGEMGSGAENF